MYRTRRIRNRRSGRCKRGGGGCWDCSPEKKEFKRIRNENMDKDDLQQKLNEYFMQLDNNKLVELYLELNPSDKKYVDTYLPASILTKETFDKMLAKKIKTVAYQAADNVADHLNPIQSFSRSALMALKSLRKSSPNTQSESEPQSESVAVGGKSRRSRRGANKKSRKVRKSHRSRHRHRHRR
jgi:hypothetical protein